MYLITSASDFAIEVHVMDIKRILLAGRRFRITDGLGNLRPFLRTNEVHG